MSQRDYEACIEACVQCAQACEHCADACLSEKDVKKMAECIRTDRDCASMCWTTAALMGRGSQFVQDVCRVCADICERCAGQGEKHEMDHCQECATACRKCAEECRQTAGITA